jgi:DNA-binding HxlR family transcriptional regulator
MADYRQYCPVARASEVFADRWTPLIIRELLAGMRHFNEIERGLPGISRSLLSSRLRHLQDCGVVECHRGTGPHATEYHLTDAGRDLQRVITSLGAWAVKWAFGDPRPEELNPVHLLWMIKRRLRIDRMPRDRVIIEFDFSGRGGRRLWLVVEPRESSVCLRPPGFDSDLIIRADLAFFYRLWLGYIDYGTAIRSSALIVEGSKPLTRAFPQWLMFSPMAPYVRAEQDGERLPA